LTENSKCKIADDDDDDDDDDEEKKSGHTQKSTTDRKHSRSEQIKKWLYTRALVWTTVLGTF
jgi:hypothetical protein